MSPEIYTVYGLACLGVCYAIVLAAGLVLAILNEEDPEA